MANGHNGSKYQILVDANGKHSVIERTSGENGKEFWNIYVPDARDRNVASRLARLLNEEYEHDRDLRAQRRPSEA